VRPFTFVFSAFAASMLLAQPQAAADVLIAIDKSNQRMTIEVDGVPRCTWPVSTGRIGHDTPSGSFRALWMETEHFSKEWDNAPMPHAIFFTDSGHAIHGTGSIKQLGSPASHGCIRLAPQNAEKLYAVVHEQGLSHTTIVGTGDAQIASAERGWRRSPLASAGTMDRKSEAADAQHPTPSVREPRRRFEEAAYQTFGDFQPD